MQNETGRNEGLRIGHFASAIAAAILSCTAGCDAPVLGTGRAPDPLDPSGVSSPVPPPMAKPTGPAVHEVDPGGGPPGTVITVYGAELDPSDQIAVFAPDVDERKLPTTWASASALRATIPPFNVQNPATLDVRVRRKDGSALGPLAFQLRPGRVLFVAPAGDDSYDGTIDHPLETVRSAVDRMSPGDVVYLRGGRYAEQIQVTKPGAAGAPLVVSGMPGEDVLVELPRGVPGSAVIVRSGRVVIDRLRVTNLGDEAGVSLDANSYFVVVGNCEVFGTHGQGIMVSGQANLITRNHVHDNGARAAYDHGIYVEGERNVVHENVVHDNYAYGIHIYNGYGQSARNNVVEYNLVYNNGWGTVNDNARSPTAGIVVALGGEYATIQYNRVCANAQYGIYLIDKQPGAIVRGNVTCENARGGFLYSLPGEGAESKGNISYNDRGFALSAASGITSDRNAFWVSSGPLRFLWMGAQLDFAGYRKASGQDGNSQIANPNFRGAPPSGFDLQSATTYDFCTALIPDLCTPPGMLTWPPQQ